MAEQIDQRVDAVVLGMGPGGEEVAGRLADAGLDVVGIDEHLVGGERPYYACVPTKIMARAAHLIAEAHRIPGMAGTCMVSPVWTPVARHVLAAACDFDDRAAVERFRGRGGRFVRGRGRLTGPDEVSVEDADERSVVFRARRAIVVATGAVPAVPPVVGLPATPYWTHREAVRAARVPESLIVLGGGATGLELAQLFARFGTDVQVVESQPRLLPREEPDADGVLLPVLNDEGLVVRVGCTATSAEHDGSAFTVTTDRGDILTAERLLVATGRRVDVAGTGAGALGLALPEDAAALPVDDRMRLVLPNGRQPGVWAVGDVTGRGAYTHVALAQADVAVRGILGVGGYPASAHVLSRVTFTDPEVGAVGLTEAQAVERGLTVRTGHADLAGSARGAIHRAGNAGFVKLVADADAGALLGATAAGPNGGEVLGALSLAVQARVPLAELRRTVWAYPTFHRAIGDALAEL